MQLDQSLIKEAAFIPADYGGGYDAAHTLYYGLNVDTVSSNLGLIAETAAEEEYRRGGLFVALDLFVRRSDQQQLLRVRAERFGTPFPFGKLYAVRRDRRARRQ